MTVYRPDPLQYEEIEAELKKKAGKPFGISCRAPLRGPGVYLSELVCNYVFTKVFYNMANPNKIRR